MNSQVGWTKEPEGDVSTKSARAIHVAYIQPITIMDIMSNYSRLFVKGGTYFFTLVTHNRQQFLCEESSITRLKAAFHYAKNKYPFQIIALVILPDHLHCVWKLPENDDNFSIRWSMIKRYFSIGFEASINYRREKEIWQRRFWEHLVRDDRDLNRCLDYIHYNPVKHGYVKTPYDWKYSTFRHHVSRGYYDSKWGCGEKPKDMKEWLLE